MNCYEVASLVENGISNLDIRSREVNNHVPESSSGFKAFRQVSEATCGFLPERPNGNKQSSLVFQVRGVLTHIGRALTPRQEQTNGKFFPFFWKYTTRTNCYQMLRQFQRLGLVQKVFLMWQFWSLFERRSTAMGSHMTDKIYQLLEIPRITVFLDRDEAGMIGAQKAVAVLRKHFSAEAFDLGRHL